MNDFTASNGVEISLTNGGKTLFLESPGGSWPNPEEHSLLLNTDFGAALREFFRAEEDERLGRWRWPENSSITVREAPERAQKWPALTVMIQDDISGYVGYYTRKHLPEITARTGDIVRAGHAYFAAHPEPKPWHDAKPDDVWILTIDGEEVPAHIDEDREFRHLSQGRGRFRSVLDKSITAGRRIYPEATS